MRRLVLLGALALVVGVAPASAYPVSKFTIWTIAGNGTGCSTAPACGDGGAADRVPLTAPSGVVVDAAGDVYVADTGDNEVREISPAGTITRIAGTGTPCTTAPSCGDGRPATRAELTDPNGPALDAAGTLYIADSGDHEIRAVSPCGTINRIAGTGTACATAPSCGDGARAISAQLNSPLGVAVDAAGNVYIGDAGDDEVREVSPGVTITRLAGAGSPCANPPNSGRSRSPREPAFGRLCPANEATSAVVSNGSAFGSRRRRVRAASSLGRSAMPTMAGAIRLPALVGTRALQRWTGHPGPSGIPMRYQATKNSAQAIVTTMA